MKPTTFVIIGLIIGHLFTLPQVYKWKNFPVIHVLAMPHSVYEQRYSATFVIDNVITKYRRKPTPMRIVITSMDNVSGLYKQLFNESGDGLAGFYYFDNTAKEHVVVSCDSTHVLQHEIRHAFEGTYHRSLD